MNTQRMLAHHEYTSNILTNLGPVISMGVKAFHQMMLAGGTLVGGTQLSILEVPITATVSDGCSSNVVEITVRRKNGERVSLGKHGNLPAISKVALSLTTVDSELIAMQL